MKKNRFFRSMAIVAAAVFMMSAMPGDGVISKVDGMTVVNTTSLATDVEGYLGTTPLKIYIKNNKIEKIEALPNQETPKYFAKVKKEMLAKYAGMNVNKAVKTKVDGVTGATLSSDAVRVNVQRGLDYYKKKK
jgi:electron transport complex protein RnfG